MGHTGLKEEEETAKRMRRSHHLPSVASLVLKAVGEICLKYVKGEVRKGPGTSR